MNPRLFFYRAIARSLCRLARRPLSAGLADTFESSEHSGGFWFHAASVGELEGLLPLIQECAAHQSVAAVSVWSHSGDPALIKLHKELGVPVLRAPHEGDWAAQFQRAQPRAVVCYRYDAWPDLWASCAERGIPLVLVGARVRTSLRVVKGFLKVLGVPLPKLGGTVFDASQREALAVEFPRARFSESPNPRWERASLRVTGPSSPAAQAEGQKIAELPQPVLFLSQVWESDFEGLGLELSSWTGSVVCVPHSLSADNIEKLKKRMKNSGAREFLMVEKGGVLAELYRLAHCVYVGGGFERGIHSVIEPACAGVPVACGPLRAGEFEETALLVRDGQLEILKTSDDWFKCLEKWVKKGRDKAVFTSDFGKLPPDFWWKLLNSQVNCNYD